MTTTALTEAEYKTLKAILAMGGYEGSGHMGRLSKARPIRKTTLRRLEERGLVETQTLLRSGVHPEDAAHADALYRSQMNPVRYHYVKVATAAGCKAVNEYEARHA